MLLAAAIAAAFGGRARAEDGFRPVLPVACEVGRTCFIQNYVDADASDGAKDYRCGTLTYNDHNGTDFRVPSIAAQRRGVNVLAAADGKVLRVRDGVPDRSVREKGRESVRGTECGNGMVIAHGDGWETQYCHMAAGSITVKSGEAVKAGQPVGRVGLSGLTEYPHLHFMVRKEGKVVDPFAYEAAPGSCGGGRLLWADALAHALVYRDSAVLNSGFATEAVTMEAIEDGSADDAAPAPDSPVIVAFVRAIGLKGGDVQSLTLRGPDGAVVARNEAKPLDRDKAQVMLFTGKKRPAAGWPRGTYTAIYTVERDGKTVLKQDFAFTL